MRQAQYAGPCVERHASVMRDGTVRPASPERGRCVRRREAASTASALTSPDAASLASIFIRVTTQLIVQCVVMPYIATPADPVTQR